MTSITSLLSPNPRFTLHYTLMLDLLQSNLCLRVSHCQLTFNPIGVLIFFIPRTGAWIQASNQHSTSPLRSEWKYDRCKRERGKGYNGECKHDKQHSARSDGLTTYDSENTGQDDKHLKAEEDCQHKAAPTVFYID